jgi:hypothetical protein
MIHRKLALVWALAIFLLSSAGLEAQDQRPFVRPPIALDATGSWFGRAVPVDPFCPPGAPGCPVPREIVMLPTFFADGTFIGIDSNVFLEGDHTTAHGQWEATSVDTLGAQFLFLQEGANGVFAGAFRLTLDGEMVTPNLMTGFIVGYFFPFTDPTGAVVIDPETGFPVPDPLGPLPEECLPGLGCLGRFDFVLRRIPPSPGNP